MQDPVRERGEDQVRLLRRDAGRDRLLGVERAEPDLHQRVRADDVGRGALHHRHVDAVLPQRGADVVGGVVRADHDHALALEPVRARVLRTSAAARRGRRPGPGSRGRSALPDIPVASTSCFGRSVTGSPSRSSSTTHSCASSSQRADVALVERPVVQLHHARVGLEPVADLVLRREDRPVVRELDVRQVVVPDRVVEAERLVAAAPRVARPRVAVDDDRRDVELAQPRAEPDPALAAADHEHVGLRLVAELARLALAPLEPRLTALVRAVLGAHRPLRPLALLVALELLQRREERPRRAVAQPQVPDPAAGLGLEREPRLGDAVRLGRLRGRAEPARPDVAERVLEHVAHPGRALDRADVPRERHEVAPEAGLQEQRGRRLGVAALQRVVEGGEPGIDLLAGGLRALGGLGHCSPPSVGSPPIVSRRGPAAKRSASPFVR